jgi:hypothetical protein
MGPKRSFIIVLCVVITTLLVLPADAANNQGLYWGVAEGDRFDYYSHTSEINPPSTKTTESDFSYYVVIDALPDIPNNLSFREVFVYSLYIECFSANGTEIDPRNIIFAMMPVGNWTLYTEIVEHNSYLYNLTIIETDAQWGYEITGSIYDVGFIYRILLSKSDGVMDEYSISHFQQSTGDERTSLSIHRVSLAGSLIFGGLAVGLIAVTVIAFEYHSRRKRLGSH